MTQQTANLNLSKPEMTDKISTSIPQIAANFDIIDSSLAEKATKFSYVIDEFGTVDKTGATNVSTIIQNAINSLPSNATLILTSGTYLITSQINLKSNINIVGFNVTLKNTYTSPVTVFYGENISNVKLRDISIDGGASGATSDINFTRTVRFINCSNIRINDCEVSHGYDWMLSFETCTDCHVRNHRSYGLGDGFPGGRDGIHFLDCDNCSVDGAYIESGDDCVASTTKNKTSTNITFKNIQGKSSIGSMITFGQETGTTSQHDLIYVENILALSNVGSVVKVLGLSSPYNGRVTIKDAKGTANGHGIWVTNVDNLKILGGCDVVSTGGHGIYAITGNKVTIGEGVTGKATGTTYDGIHVQSFTHASLIGCEAKESGLWGIQMYQCTYVVMNGVRSVDNGGVNFASNTGGNLRVFSCTNLKSMGGVFSGANTTSYYGIRLDGAGNTNVKFYYPILGGATTISDATFLVS